MYANCEQVHLKGTLGKLVSQNVDQLCDFYTEFDMICYKFSSLYWQSPITVSGKVKEVMHCIMSLISSKGMKRSGSHDRGHVLGQDYSSYASNKY